MVLLCECGRHAIELIDASETTDEDGLVESFVEFHKCDYGQRGSSHAHDDNTDTLIGCLTTDHRGGAR